MSDISLNHDAAFPELGALALGALDAPTASAVEGHASACTICTAELAALRGALEELPSMPDSRMSPARSREIRSRLVSRAEGKAQPVRPSGAWLLAIAASIALVASLWGYVRERNERTQVEQRYAQRDAELKDMEATVRDQDSKLAAITGPLVSVMEMSATGINAPKARMFWDRATNRWTVFAHGLAKPKPGRAYELWLVTADKKIPAGVFRPSEDGSAVFTATYALRPEELKAIAVTDEPEAGVPAPTGSIVLLGSASGT